MASHSIPIRCTTREGQVMWRAVPADRVDDHGVLCRAFSLDPASTRFDLPTTWRGVGSARSGLGPQLGGRRRIEGYAVQGGRQIAHLQVCFEGERLPEDSADRYFK